jgi:O-succinylbenzoate synthase
MRKMALRHSPLNEHEALGVRLHQDEKLNHREVAAQLGVSSERVRQIYRVAKARLKDFAENDDDALARLPTRAITVLSEICIATRAQTRAAIETGRLSWSERG